MTQKKRGSPWTRIQKVTTMRTTPSAWVKVWAMAACLATRLAEMAANCAVMVVPMLEPMARATAVYRSTSPLPARTMMMPVQAELLWMMTVANMPTRMAPRTAFGGMMPSTGAHWKYLKAVWMNASSRRVPFIMSMPRKRKPKPMTTCPQWLTVRWRLKFITSPMMMAGKMTELILKATNCPVIVVPIWAPQMMPMDCSRFRSPAFTKPTTITVVAAEDWITEVTPTPVSTATNRFLAKRRRMERILVPATFCKPSLIKVMP